jgi:hypothetical protein
MHRMPLLSWGIKRKEYKEKYIVSLVGRVRCSVGPIRTFISAPREPIQDPNFCSHSAVLRMRMGHVAQVFGLEAVALGAAAARGDHIAEALEFEFDAVQSRMPHLAAEMLLPGRAALGDQIH